MQYLLKRCPKASEIRENAENLPLHVACMGDFDNDRNLIVHNLVKAYHTVKELENSQDMNGLLFT